MPGDPPTATAGRLPATDTCAQAVTSFWNALRHGDVPPGIVRYGLGACLDSSISLHPGALDVHGLAYTLLDRTSGVLDGMHHHRVVWRVPSFSTTP